MARNEPLRNIEYPSLFHHQIILGLKKTKQKICFGINVSYVLKKE